MTKPEQSGPADTRMMTIVHNAIRRDLARAAKALTQEPPPTDRQRRAIAAHLGWMMAFLRAHHESEDVGLYPAVRERRPDAGQILDDMERDHALVASHVEAVAAAAHRYGTNSASPTREDLLRALAELAQWLLPHLEREEREAMPIVATALSHSEWLAIENEHTLEAKGTVQLAMEGHWLIDSASIADRTTVLGLVPPAQRFFLLHAFRLPYRRRREACWPSTRAPRRIPRHGSCEVVVAADIDAVWEVVIDLPRVGEWSHECVECSFLGGARRAAPGVRFRGRNRQGIFRWGRICEVLSADDHELVWRTVPTRWYPDSTVWRIRVAATDEGTLIQQRFDVVGGSKLLEKVYSVLVPAHRDRGDALTDDLRRLGVLAGEGMAEHDPLRIEAPG